MKPSTPWSRVVRQGHVCWLNFNTSANIRDIGVPAGLPTLNYVDSANTIISAAQSVQNVCTRPVRHCRNPVASTRDGPAARVVLCLRRRDQHSLTAALRELHWLPIAQRIQFKLLTLMQSALDANSPRCLADRISPYVPCRSTDEHSHVQVPPSGTLFQ